jgi:hypothetical protein
METQMLLKLLKGVMVETFNLPHIHQTYGSYVYAAIFTNQTRAKAFAKEISERTPYIAVVEKEWHHKALYVDQPTYVVGIREKAKRKENK